MLYDREWMRQVFKYSSTKFLVCYYSTNICIIEILNEIKNWMININWIFELKNNAEESLKMREKNSKFREMLTESY